MGATVIESIPSRISYATISGYARDLQIEGEDFDRFLKLLRAIDEEYLAIVGEAFKERLQRIQQSAR